MKASQPSRLARLGVCGFDAAEPVVLAALVTEDPLLLIGPPAPARPSHTEIPVQSLLA